MSNNKIQNQIAIIGVGSTGFSRSGGPSARTLAADAAIAAIRDTGLKREDIGGVVSSAGPGNWMLVPPGVIEFCSMMRFPNITYFQDGNGVMIGPLIDAMNAIYSGACDTVLVYHYNYRTPAISNQAASDPFRQGFPSFTANVPPDTVHFAPAYAAWAGRYMHENNISRETLGYIAINDRTNAANNPLAAMRTPITMDDYMNARMIRDPLSMLDMDVPVDGAEAFVLTSVERARDLVKTPVLINVAVQGLVETGNDDEQLRTFQVHSQNIVVRQLWERSSYALKDIDLAYIYDGFSPIAPCWIERLGYCGYGEAGDFIRQHWNAKESRILIDGRVPVNSNGGMLSEGGSQAAGFVREAVHQLRGSAGPRQIGTPKAAMIAAGGFFMNSQAAMLVRDQR